MDSLRQEEIDAAEHTNETTIYVKNLNFETTEARLEKLFKKVLDHFNIEPMCKFLISCVF